MFSANENLMLREHKRRVVSYIEDTIPEEILDLGTTVMVMQTACRTPGCVPLETAIAIVFPRIAKGELIPGIKESDGGTFKTRILLPLSEVTKEDVLDALPPGFQGGRKTWESTCLQLRDFVFGRIGGLVGNGDVDDGDGEVNDRRILAEYLKNALEDYLNRGCKAPPLGQPFLEEKKNELGQDGGDDDDDFTEKIIKTTNDSTARTRTNEEKVVGLHLDDNLPQVSKTRTASEGSGGRAAPEAVADIEVVQGSMQGGGNFVIRRKGSNDASNPSLVGKAESLSKTTTAITGTNPIPQRMNQVVLFNRVDNGRHLDSNLGDDSSRRTSSLHYEPKPNILTSSVTTSSVHLQPSASDRMLQTLSSKLQHAPGIRSPGCPCCDPDNIATVVDSMLV